MVNDLEAAPNCSFCAKAAHEVRKIIAGPGIYICDECVAKCDQILAGDDGASAARLPEWETMTDEQILDRLPRIAVVAAQVDASLRVRVDELRGRGVTWSRISSALGITRQSAWERFAG